MLRSRSTWPALAIVLLAIAVPGEAAVEGRFERTLQVAGPVTLDVSTGSGSIVVRPGDEKTVRVLGRIRAREGLFGGRLSAEERVRRIEAAPPIEQTGNQIRIGHIEDAELRRNVSISYEVIVPQATEVQSGTGSGSQAISGIRGPVKAGTGSGTITISEIDSEVRASTGSGEIHISGIDGPVNAQTGSGSIQARGVAGAFVGRTGSGDVAMQQVSSGNVDVETGSGEVSAEGVNGAVRVHTASGSIRVEGRPTDAWDLHAASGSITVTLPGGLSFDLDARTGSGSIDVDHPVTVAGKMRRNELRGKVGGGGVLVTLRTSSGDISVH